MGALSSHTRIAVSFTQGCCSILLVAAAGAVAASGNLPDLVFGTDNHLLQPRPALPEYLRGRPESWQERHYGPDVDVAPHTAEGPGLSAAYTGVPASFTVRLGRGVGDGDGGRSDEEEDWDYNVNKKRFIYVWVASEDHVFVAAVQNNWDGTLTASYESGFPGDYLVHVEDVDLNVRDKFGRGRPIVGSPFSLTITGEPTILVDDLPVCGEGSTAGDKYGGAGGGSEDGEEGAVASAFWRTGSWVSSNLAAERHGVLRDGWVFQPKGCAYESFTYEDLMLLAGLEEPTWFLTLGNSILRGVFLTLVDMALAEGQKDEMRTSVLRKCWGFVDVRIGNLRLTYQDLRLYTVMAVEDATVCNDEKLASGSTAAYVLSAELFLKDYIFREGAPWPSVISAPSNMIDSDEAPNLQIRVLMDALPSTWKGDLVMMDHLYAYGYGWNTGNPTLSTLGGVSPVNEFSPNTTDSGVARMEGYIQRDPRVTFMSAFPIYQARLFENEFSRIDRRCYGCSIHYHYVSEDPDSPEAYGGAKMVHSAVTETLANVLVSKAVGTKKALYEKAAAATSGTGAELHAEAPPHFELCSDCPSSLIPLHVKPVPLLTCRTTSSLPGNASVGAAWNDEVCPAWCMAKDPDTQASVGSGLVDVRVCGRP